MKDFSIKKAILCSLMFLISLFTLLALCFHLVNASVMNIGYGESGFSYFKFSSTMIPYKGMIIPFGIVSIIQLIVSIVMIALSLLAFFKYSKEKYTETGKTIIQLGLVFCSLYLAMGIACTIVFRVVNGSGAEYGGSIMTYSFLPLVFVIIFAIAYKVCKNMIPEDLGMKNGAKPANKTRETAMNSEYSKADLLKEYGELLDKGYITREEFDAKKAEILKKEGDEDQKQ